MATTHADGTLCKEGTSSLPRGFVACCEIFAAHTTTCEHDVRYEWWARRRHWVIVIAESVGGGGVLMNFCPHCGTSLRKRR